MDKERKALIWTVFDNARPYISEVKWLKTRINEVTENVKTEQEFIKLLREEEEKLEDSIKRTDIRIYLTHFERHVVKS